MSPEREIEFGELRAFVNFFATNILGISPDTDIHPARTIEHIIRTYGKSKALAGLRQAVNDTIEETSNWNLEARAILDKALKDANIVTLSTLIRRYAGMYKRILKRGKIRCDTEYYVVNCMLIDQGNDISDEERGRLQELVDAYEGA